MRGDYRLGDWTIRPSLDQVERGEEMVHIKPKAMAVLDRLAEGHGEVVTRDELFEAVWPAAVVSDATLTQCIAELRHALGDSAQSPSFIETIPKVGFRLVAPIAPLPSSDDAGNVAVEARTQAARARRRPGAPAAALVLITLILVTAWHLDGWKSAETRPLSDEKSLAVLPFVDASPGRDQGWIADGLAAELIAHLARIPDLKVIGQASSFRYREASDDPRLIAETLGVRYLLEGSVRRSGQHVRITTRLLDAASGFNVWSEVFDSDYADLIAVQDEIAESILIALSISLKVGELAQVDGGPSVVKAFEAYQRAWDLFLRSTESHLEGIHLLEQAVDWDPDYALAWVALATFYDFGPRIFEDTLPVDWTEPAEAALRKARELAPNSPIVLAASIDAHMTRHEWSACDRLLARADPRSLELHPTVLFSRGLALIKTGRGSEAVAVLERAQMLDPLRVDIATQLAHAYLINGQAEDSLDLCERAWSLEEPPHWMNALICFESALSSTDRNAIALWLERILKHTPEGRLGVFPDMAERLDEPLAARAILRAAFERDMPVISADYWTANWAAYFGDTDLAIDALLRTPDSYGLWNPLMAEVRRHPVFRRVVGKLGLDAYWREYGWPPFCRPVGTLDMQCE
ncbi:MAG: winged helix-turn-helix domain-containing protein [Xanthomonadales bacterium]